MKTIFIVFAVTFLGLATHLHAQTQTPNPAAAATPGAQPQTLSNQKLSDSALNYECKNGDRIRRIKVEHKDPVAKTGCVVRYIKETEEPGSEGNIKWDSDARFSYCEEEAAKFVTKQENEFHFTCVGKD